jgi:hypothetical protein
MPKKAELLQPAVETIRVFVLPAGSRPAQASTFSFKRLANG